MLLKSRAKNKLYDILHQSVVYVCMSITVVGTGYVGYRGYKYFTEVKPTLKAQQLKKIKEGDGLDTAKTVAT